jgi:hypothetical protein
VGEAKRFIEAPPRNFKPAGALSWAEHSPISPPFVKNPYRKGARGRGLAYEAKVHKEFEERFPEGYVAGPWFRFRAVGDKKDRWCQPDGLLFVPQIQRIFLIEIKLRHTADAWWQTRLLYLPILAHLFPESMWDFCICEVVRWFDPATSFPESFDMLPDLLGAQPSRFGVHILKP